MLFDKGPRKRNPRRVLMHVIDAGSGSGENWDLVRYGCRCGYESEWTEERRSVARRGVPCPKCNEAKRC